MKTNKKALIIIYIILTFIKFFTMRIDKVREEDPTIYFKFYPTVENSIIGVVEDGELKDYFNIKYSWYEKNQYWEICHSAGGLQEFTEYFYKTLIALWWISSFILIGYAIYKLVFEKA